jgi:hypothetical protein
MHKAARLFYDDDDEVDASRGVDAGTREEVVFVHAERIGVGRSRRLFRITDNDGGAALCYIVRWQQRTFDSGFYGGRRE